MASRYMPEMTWVQVKEYLDQGGDLAILSLGSIENHGPHSPLGTDHLITEALGSRLAEAIDALLAPVMPMGFCPQHLPFPGSISLSNETLSRVLLEAALCLVGQGFRRFVLLSGHGGNRVALEMTAAALKMARPEVQVLHANILTVQTSRPIREKVEQAYGKPLSTVWEAHGGEQETAAVLAVRPELVDLSKAAPEPDMTAYLSKARDAEVSRVDYDLISHAPAGNWGDPRGATAEQGEIFYRVMVEHLAAKIAQKWG